MNLESGIWNLESGIWNPELRRVQGHKPYVVYGLEFIIEN